MFNFMKLVQNENMKIYRRPRTYVMLGLLLALIAAISIIGYFVDDNHTASAWSMIMTEVMISYMLVTVFTIIIASSSVADEFTSGTIKLLLIRPWTRSKVLLSKYIAVLLYALGMVVVMLVFTVILNMILFGYTNETASEVISPLVSGSVMAYLLKYSFLKYVSLVVTTTLAFMLATVSRSGALAIGLSLFLILGVNSFSPLLASLKYKWADYILFIHLDLTQYLNDTPMRDGTTLGFSVLVLAIYYAIFVGLAWYVFKKRDVAA
ncbi:ABC-2 type transport system permease protein [Paenibacillus catalpae]|uniref:ABC-2 type transport system permease protein n=1 Tax=Paenibacillus catalpae TaxID=1045775 RepID=A0A1I1Y2K9_9BACL|nr:ABC transporter permease [Paenibacillus catalpae]SFE12303.1 ABC-2 type transport system permease protein [Paenibacillus catalpae]